MFTCEASWQFLNGRYLTEWTKMAFSVASPSHSLALTQAHHNGRLFAHGVVARRANADAVIDNVED
jgi:hypothetical protein